VAERVIALVVVLEDTINGEEAEDTVRLLSRIRNVSSVRVVPEDITSAIARDRARTELKGQIMDVLGIRRT
jgi:hypothetical protein